LFNGEDLVNMNEGELSEKFHETTVTQYSEIKERYIFQEKGSSRICFILNTGI
jgi:hypothetical protein